MNDETLQRIVAELEMLAADAEPRSHITQGKPDSFIFLAANKPGLIWLARSLLMAALSSPAEGEALARPTTIEEPHSQVRHSARDLAIGWIEHSEVVPIPDHVIAERKRLRSRNDQIALLGCSIVALIILFRIRRAAVVQHHHGRAGAVTGSVARRAASTSHWCVGRRATC